MYQIFEGVDKQVSRDDINNDTSIIYLKSGETLCEIIPDTVKIVMLNDWRNSRKNHLIKYSNKAGLLIFHEDSVDPHKDHVIIYLIGQIYPKNIPQFILNKCSKILSNRQRCALKAKRFITSLFQRKTIEPRIVNETNNITKQDTFVKYNNMIKKSIDKFCSDASETVMKQIEDDYENGLFIIGRSYDLCKDIKDEKTAIGMKKAFTKYFPIDVISFSEENNTFSLVLTPSMIDDIDY